MKRILTIGYEGVSLSDFTATLKKSRVNVLLDVRELPLSRRRGFSKNALREAVNEAGIAYRHEKLLGSPRKMRHRLREDGDYKSFFRAYRKHLTAQSDLLGKLADELTGNVVLLCYERDHEGCHRSVVAEALSSLANVVTVHLEVTDGESGKTCKAAPAHTRQSVSAA